MLLHCVFLVAALAGFSPEIIKAIRAIKDHGSMEINTKRNHIFNILDDHKLSRVAPVNVSDLACHPSNARFNHHDVHRKGATVIKTGCDFSKLTEACCIEFSKKPEKRAEQLQMNLDLVKRSHGMLSPLNGWEDKLTLAASHIVAFCRAVLAGCTTNRAQLTSNGENLSLSHIVASEPSSHPLHIVCHEGFNALSHPLHILCHEGFNMRVLPAELEELFPDLPGMIQQSYTLAISAYDEMETAAFVADYYQTMKISRQEPSLEQAVKYVGSMQPMCQAYLPVLAMCVANFAGGDEFPIVHFLASYSRVFGGSLILGEQFMTSVTYADFKHLDPITSAPFLRAALIAAQLTADKSWGGVATLLVKSDVTRLQSYKMKPKASETESLMAAAWRLLESGKAAGLDADVANGVFGKFLTRCILHILDKEQFGREPQGFNNLDEIYSIFADEIKSKLCFGSKTGVVVEPSDEAVGSSDPAKIAIRMRLKVGEQCVHKDHPDRIFVFTSINATHGIFIHKPLFQALDDQLQDEVVTTELKNTRDWKAFKGSAPALVPKVLAEGLLPDKVESIRDECLKAWVHKQLVDNYTSNQVSSDALVFASNPDALYTAKDFKKGELKLYPIGPVVKVSGHRFCSHNLLIVKENGQAHKIFSVKYPKCSLDLKN